MRLPDPPRSRALLLGSSRFDDPALPDLPGVRNNLTDLAETLTSPWATRLASEHCVVLPDQPDRAVIGHHLNGVAAQAQDLLLVYYAGHGLIGPDGSLYLSLPSTRGDRDMVSWTALPFELLRRTLAGARADNRVLILDCCFSGLALGDLMTDITSAVSGQIEIAGTCTLASSPANRPSNAPTTARYTAYTGELLEIMHRGPTDDADLLTLAAIYEHLDRALPAKGFPRPEQRNTRTIGQLALAARPPRTHPAPTSPKSSTTSQLQHPTPLPAVADASRHQPLSPSSVPLGLARIRRPILVGVLVAAAVMAVTACLMMVIPQAQTAPATIRVGAPWAVAVDPSGHTLYVANLPKGPQDGTISVIDTTTRTVTATIPVGHGDRPWGVAVDPSGHTLYVTNDRLDLKGPQDGTISVIDTATRTVTATIPFSGDPKGVAVDPSGHTIYVTNGDSYKVSVIDTGTRTVTGTVPVGQIPDGVAVAPGGHAVYVANFGDDTVSVIDTATLTTTTVPGGHEPGDVAVDPTGHTLYVTNGDSDAAVSVIDIDTRTITATIPVGRGTGRVAVDPSGHTVYVTNDRNDANDGTMSAIDTDTRTVTATYHVGRGSWGVAVDPDGHSVYVTNHGADTVSVIHR